MPNHGWHVLVPSSFIRMSFTKSTSSSLARRSLPRRPLLAVRPKGRASLLCRYHRVQAVESAQDRLQCAGELHRRTREYSLLLSKSEIDEIGRIQHGLQAYQHAINSRNWRDNRACGFVYVTSSPCLGYQRLEIRYAFFLSFHDASTLHNVHVLNKANTFPMESGCKRAEDRVDRASTSAISRRIRYPPEDRRN